MPRRTKTVVLILCCLVLIPACGPSEPPTRSEILWDTWGVPHVFAESWEGLFYSYGWAQAASHGDLILRLYGEARGRAAEYWGEEHLDSDRYIRRMGVPKRAAEWLDQQTPAMSAYLQAFAAGINDYAESHPEAIDDRFEVVLPVEAADVLAHLQRVLHLEFLGRGMHRLSQDTAVAGSNGWAIGPERSESGNAMMLANPHLPWGGFFRLFEAHLVGPGVDAYGASIVGVPVLNVGFNDRLGWTLTTNPVDGADLYEVFTMGEGYAWPPVGEGPDFEREFEVEREIIRVLVSDGAVREEELIIRRTEHGPVVADRGGSVLVARLAGLDQPYVTRQFWEMMRAEDLESFEASIRDLQLPMFNIIYADQDGRIMYVFNGRIPFRAPGSQPAFWSGLVPGNHPATLWTRTHTYSELPRVVDPESGWVQNANDPPWTSTFPMALSPKDYPTYFAPRGMSLRAQRSVRMLDEDEKISFEEMIAYKHSTRMELADRILDDLVPAARRRGGLASRAAGVLDAWDRTADADSRGAVLFARWVRELGSLDDLFRIPWDEENPRTTPDGLADPAAAVAALESAARAVESEHGALDVPWGDVYRLRVAGRDLPANGAPESLGVFRVVSYAKDGNVYRSVEGDSFVAAVEFADPVRARVLLSYGNASRPGSPHNGDQLELFAGKQLRPAWRSRSEIEANLEQREEVVYRR